MSLPPTGAAGGSKPANGGANDEFDSAVESRPRRSGPLSAREREILELLCDGMSGAMIADRLVLSPETVRTHIRNAMAKLGAATRSQAIAVALREGELGPQDGASPRSADSAPATRAMAPPKRTARTPLASAPTAAALKTLLAGLVSLWDVDGGVIYLGEPDGLVLRRVARFGEGTQTKASGTAAESLKLGDGPLGRVALERRAQISRAEVVSRSADGRSPQAMIGAPILAGGRLVGVIGLSARPSRPTGRTEMLLLQALANRVGEILVSAGDQAPERLDRALERFRASWTAATATT
jgi:DNA-binding CsgD family transcriptional regulator